MCERGVFVNGRRSHVALLALLVVVLGHDSPAVVPRPPHTKIQAIQGISVINELGRTMRIDATSSRVVQTDTCVFSGGLAPSPGMCSGPMERAMVRMTKGNYSCGPNQVKYDKDGDPAQPWCGQCIPGSSGVEDDLRICKIDEYCDDDGRCSRLDRHPLFQALCPWEQGGATAQGWCGPGLRCIHHHCVQCMPGTLDPTDGKICLRGWWTYSRWARMWYSPSDFWLFMIFLFLTIWCCCDTGLRLRASIFRKRIHRLRLRRRNALSKRFPHRAVPRGSDRRLLAEDIDDDRQTGAQCQCRARFPWTHSEIVQGMEMRVMTPVISSEDDILSTSSEDESEEGMRSQGTSDLLRRPASLGEDSSGLQ